MDFYPGQEIPVEKKPHWALYIIAVAIIVVLAGVLVIGLSKKAPVPSAPVTEVEQVNFEPTMTLTEKRERLFELVAEAETRELSSEERIEILTEFGGERTGSYNFTPEEEDKIIEALNK